MKKYSARALALSFLTCLVLQVITVGSDVARAVPVTGPSVIMTFDDIGGGNGPAMTGYVLPQMQTYGYRGVAYVVASLSGAVPVGQSLANAGWEIGSHSMTHPHLSDDGLSPSDLTYEIVYSKTYLESHIVGTSPVITFAYPHGDGNQNTTVVSYVRAAGYWLARDASGYDGIPWDGTSGYSEPGMPIMPYMIDDGSVIGEYIYRDFDSSTIVSVGDVRLIAVPPYAAGSTVASGDSDIGSSLRAFASLERHRENMNVNGAYDLSSVDHALFDAKSTGKDVILLSHGGDITSANFGIVLSKIRAAISRGDISGVATFKDVMSSARVRLYLVVRGIDDNVYYRVYDGSNWGSWLGLPGGQTHDGPAAAVFDGRLHIVINGTDGGLSWGSVNLTDNTFSGWTAISGEGTPTLTALDTELYLVVRGKGNGIWYRFYDGSSWTNWIGLGGLTPSRPAAAVYGGSLQIVVRGLGDGVWWGRVNLTTGTFSGWTPISGIITSGPTLTASDTELYLAVRGTSNTIWYRSYNGTWSNWVGLPGLTLSSPAADIYGGSLQLVVRGMGDELWWGKVSLATSAFSGWTGLDGLTDSEPSLA